MSSFVVSRLDCWHSSRSSVASQQMSGSVGNGRLHFGFGVAVSVGLGVGVQNSALPGPLLLPPPLDPGIRQGRGVRVGAGDDVLVGFVSGVDVSVGFASVVGVGVSFVTAVGVVVPAGTRVRVLVGSATAVRVDVGS